MSEAAMVANQNAYWQARARDWLRRAERLSKAGLDSQAMQAFRYAKRLARKGGVKC